MFGGPENLTYLCKSGRTAKDPAGTADSTGGEVAHHRNSVRASGLCECRCAALFESLSKEDRH
jgi:hypothetical protein